MQVGLPTAKENKMCRSLVSTGALVIALISPYVSAPLLSAEHCRCRSVSNRTAKRTAAIYSQRANRTARPARFVSADRVVEERTVSSYITLPAGSRIPIRLAQSLDTKRDFGGTPFIGHVASPVVYNGTVVIPRGAICRGHLVESKPSGRLKGRAVMILSLDSIELGSRRYTIRTADYTFVSKGHKGRNLAWIGGGAAGGAAIGAIAGDGVGAAIGAGAGAGAGTVGALITGRRNLRLPPETRVDFDLRQPARVRG